MGNGSFPGVKRPGRVADHPPPSKCRGQERVELYLYSLFGPSWPVMEAPFPFTADLTKSHAFMKCLYGVHNFATVNHNCGSLNRTKNFSPRVVLILPSNACLTVRTLLLPSSNIRQNMVAENHHSYFDIGWSCRWILCASVRMSTNSITAKLSLKVSDIRNI